MYGRRRGVHKCCGGHSVLRLLGAALVLVMLGNAIIAGGSIGLGDISKEELMGLLRAKDAELDNVRLDYTVSGTHTSPAFPSWRAPGIAKEHGWENEKPETIPFRYQETLVVRGPEATLVRELDPSFKTPEGKRSKMAPFQKWSNRRGLAREMVEYG